MGTHESEDSILKRLSEQDIHAPAGGAIENYYETYDISDAAIPILERFLLSSNLDNRSAALDALIIAKRYDYAADAVLLHFQGREFESVSTEVFEGLSHLASMRRGGNVAAERMAELLRSDPYVIKLWGGPPPEGHL